MITIVNTALIEIMVSLQNGLQPNSGETLFDLISMRAMSQASSQHQLCVDVDAWCKRAIKCRPRCAGTVSVYCAVAAVVGGPPLCCAEINSQ